jgi:hypothetical protein
MPFNWRVSWDELAAVLVVLVAGAGDAQSLHERRTVKPSRMRAMRAKERQGGAARSGSLYWQDPDSLTMSLPTR